jgi:hypothetical protein
MNKELAAKKIRAFLENRIAHLLDCKPEEIPRMKLGSMAHLLFLLIGDSEMMPGFNTTLSALVLLLGPELLWDIEPKAEEVETPKVVIN